MLLRTAWDEKLHIVLVSSSAGHAGEQNRDAQGGVQERDDVFDELPGDLAKDPNLLEIDVTENLMNNLLIQVQDGDLSMLTGDQYSLGSWLSAVSIWGMNYRGG